MPPLHRRRTLIARSGAPWRMLPAEYGKWNSVYRRYAAWRHRDIWTALHQRLADDPDTEYLIIDSAIADYTAAIALDAGLADAWFNRGISWYEVGDYAQSIADLTEAIRLNPEDDNYYSRRSLSYLFHDQPEAAQADMDASEAIRLRAWQ